MSLKSRLLLAIISLVLFVFCIVDIVTYSSLHSFLISREDQELSQSASEMTHELIRAASIDLSFGSNRFGPVGTTSLQAGALGKLWQNNQIITSLQVTYGNKSVAYQPFPQVSTSLITKANLTKQAYFTTSSPKSSSSQYRVLIEPLGQNYVLLEAFPLSGVNDTMNNLLRFEIYTGVLGVFAAILIGFLLVRFSLLPIEKIRKASRSVTSGDLNQRVEVSNPKTEIGELETDFNTMVARIQEEFYLRSLSEQKLRQFLSDASHELRTPLTFILGYADLLSKEEATKDPSLEKIKEQASRMAKLIDELLVLARLDEGQPLQFEPVDLRLLAHELAADLLLLDPSRSVKVEANIPVVVKGDQVKLRQVVTNFVSNIINHTEKGTAVNVSVSQKEGFGVYTVSDFGKGVEDIEKIFDRFYRENRTQEESKSPSGSGLGLSIVLAIVQAHNGKVTARRTTENLGVTFQVEIPLYR